MTVFQFITVLALGAIPMTLLVQLCATVHSTDKSATRIANIPITLIGMAGYALIASSAALATTVPLALVMNYALLFGCAAFTVYLIVRSVRTQQLPCPGCVVNWVINFVLVGAGAYGLIA